MKKSVLLVLIAIVSVFCTNAQQATITFQSDKDITVKIMAPIDGEYNPDFASNILDLKKDVSTECSVNVSDFGIFLCQFSDGYRCHAILFPNDKLEVSYINKNIVFSGTNASGQTYLNDNFTKKGLGYYFGKVDSIINKNMSEKNGFEEISKSIEYTLLKPCENDLNRMVMNGQISSNFKLILLKDIHYGFNSGLYNGYKNILEGRSKNFKPTTQDSIDITNQIYALFNDHEFINENTFHYNYSFIEDYFLFKWNRFTKENRSTLRGDYPRAIFGQTLYYLSAPKYLQPYLFGSYFLQDLTERSFTFDREKLLAFLNDQFPNSGYIPIITNLMNEKKAVEEKTKEMKGLILDESNISSLKDLTQINKLKGKYLYIDLWATYCSPCKYEFQFNEDVHKLINKYQDLAQIYISIDSDDQDTNWRKMSAYYQLNGFNIRASEALIKEIGEKVFMGNPIMIPRYFLLDPNAEVLNDKLPRPSQLTQLEEALNKVLKRN
ncbi:MAG TPA: thioredoxin-like domain-containing protein [Paludibacter sp.]